jgi:enoyl-CoA hydratase/carnithine racemase
MQSLHRQDASFFVLEVIRLYGRLLGFNCPTICLVKGAAYAGGCMLAFAHDQLYVFENGTFCCNEV